MLWKIWRKSNRKAGKYNIAAIIKTRGILRGRMISTSAKCRGKFFRRLTNQYGVVIIKSKRAVSLVLAESGQLENLLLEIAASCH